MTDRVQATALVTRLVDCFNTRRFDDATSLFAPEFTTHPFDTAAGAGPAWRLLVARYPDIRLDIDHVAVDGDVVTVRSHVQETGVLPFGAPPMLIETFRIEHDRLAEWWASTWLPDLSD